MKINKKNTPSEFRKIFAKVECPHLLGFLILFVNKYSVILVMPPLQPTFRETGKKPFMIYRIVYRDFPNEDILLYMFNRLRRDYICTHDKIYKKQIFTLFGEFFYTHFRKLLFFLIIMSKTLKWEGFSLFFCLR